MHRANQKNSEKKKHVCDICNATFRRQDHLKRHIKNIHSDHKCCPVCQKYCGTLDGLMKHVEVEHPNLTEYDEFEQLEQHKETQTGHNLCPKCKAPFKRRDHMLRHYRTLHLIVNLPCPVCGQAFKRRDHVVRHLREKHNLSGSELKAVMDS